MLVDLLREKWAGVREGLYATIDKFGDDELAFRPAAGAYCAGDLMLHIAHEERIEVHWGLARLLGEMPPAYAPEYSTPSVKAVLAEVHDATLRYVSALDDDALLAPVDLAWGQSSRPVDTLWHVIEHELHHRGELSLMLGLLGRPGLDA